jgi:membrane peptidoglycan carboxypeptidase
MVTRATGARCRGPSPYCAGQARSSRRYCWAGVWLARRVPRIFSPGCSRAGRRHDVEVRPGPSDAIRFPRWGPYDTRRGYADLPVFIASLSAHHFAVERQAVWSDALARFVDFGGYAIDGEKPRAGVRLLDRDGSLLYGASYPERDYSDFQSIPPVVVDTLLFIEDRGLLDPQNPRRNPAVAWGRLTLAIAGRAAGLLDRRFREGGASTLATQTEKFRHSPDGRTPGIGEKLRQMITASARAYQNGPDTTAARREIITTYLNSEPLASRPGYGEIIGVPEALWLWYGTELAEANRVLTAPATTNAQLARKAEVFRQVLSLLLAGRRPAYYLIEHHGALAAMTDNYLRLLAAAGIIDAGLRDAALHAELRFRADIPLPVPPERGGLAGLRLVALADHRAFMAIDQDRAAIDECNAKRDGSTGNYLRRTGLGPRVSSRG